MRRGDLVLNTVPSTDPVITIIRKRHIFLKLRSYCCITKLPVPSETPLSIKNLACAKRKILDQAKGNRKCCHHLMFFFWQAKVY
jgi:hypothetical protein